MPDLKNEVILVVSIIKRMVHKMDEKHKYDLFVLEGLSILSSNHIGEISTLKMFDNKWIAYTVYFTHLYVLGTHWKKMSLWLST